MRSTNIDELVLNKLREEHTVDGSSYAKNHSLAVEWVCDKCINDAYKKENTNTPYLHFYSFSLFSAKKRIMNRNKSLNLVSVLLALTAIIMIVLGIVMKIPAPAITGVGFLLIVWGFQVLK